MNNMDGLFADAWAKIEDAGNILILPHKDADGDAIGSAFGLYFALCAIGGKRVRVWQEEEMEHKLMGVLEAGEDAICTLGNPPDLAEIDLMISVDSSDIARLGVRGEFFERMGDRTIAIDHHATFNNFGNISICDVGVAACGEVVYHLIRRRMGLTQPIAQALFLAIASDSGGFRQSNTRPGTFEIAADLMRAGADNSAINQALFLSSTLTHTRLTALALATLEVYAGGRIATVRVTEEMMGRVGATSDDAEGLVNFPRNIIGVQLAIFFREKVRLDGTKFIKVSTRSNTDEVNVANLCAEFGGGGHARAAGCEFECGMSEAEGIFIARAEGYVGAL